MLKFSQFNEEKTYKIYWKHHSGGEGAHHIKAKTDSLARKMFKKDWIDANPYESKPPKIIGSHEVDKNNV